MATNASMLLVILLSGLTLLRHTSASDTLTPARPLVDGETLVSAGKTFALGFFRPGMSEGQYIGIWYNKISVQTVVWVANRQKPLMGSAGSLAITGNGTVIVSNNNNSIVLWSSLAWNLSNPVAQLLDNGNLVVREAGSTDPSKFVWQSFDHPTDTLLPGMKLGWDLRTGLNRNLTAWQSDDDPSPGRYAVSMDTRGSPQLIAWWGSASKWRSGPWNGVQFTNIPEMSGFSGFVFHFVNNKDEVYYMFDVDNPAIVSRLMVNQSGLVERYVWIEYSNAWNLFWYTPKGQCDTYWPCGPNGLCDFSGGSPMCNCMQGFKPKSPQGWALRDASDGCIRSSLLDCRNGTDGFTTLSHAALPDTTTVTVDMSIGLDECRARCLSNCSCTAYASANISGSGSGCLIWTMELVDLGVFQDEGQDFYVRLAAADLARISSKSSNKKKKAKIVIVVFVLLMAIVMLVCIAFCSWRMRIRVTIGDDRRDEARREDKDLELPLFYFRTLVEATGNFADENILGRGGFGLVFKGQLGEGQEIAVKKLSRTSAQGVEEFKNEVILIAKLQHRNLVRLLGYCIQGEERMLVYEYMPNKSLDSLLFDKDKSMYLDWPTRYRIIEGTARGLLYLHQDSRLRIIHRDLKASNILLDSEMNPKISDFGMARNFGGDETATRTRRIVGTYGYMSPEYAMEGIFSVKSDVFSFGVLVLEIISGQKNGGVHQSEPHRYLLGHAWCLWNAGNALQLVDASLGYSNYVGEVMRCIKVGLLCVQENPEDRPAMPSVVFMLGGDHTSFAEPKSPGFAARLLSQVDALATENEENSFNNVTLTTTIGR